MDGGRLYLRRLAVSTGLCVLLAGRAAPQSVISRQQLPPASVLVLLDNGEVLEGTVNVVGSECSLRGIDGGTLRIPVDEIAGIGSDLRELYVLQCARLRRNDHVPRVQLAEWCLRQGLLDESEALLNELAGREDLGDQVDSLRARIDVAREPPVRPHHADSSMVHETKSPHEISLADDNVKEFVRSVQPILLKSCGTAGCHAAPSDRSFQLRRADSWSRKPTQRQTLANLQAVLREVDRSRTDGSPLLVWAGKAHGGTSEPPLPAHESRFGLLRNWVGGLREEPSRPVRNRAVAEAWKSLLQSPEK